MAQDDAQQAVRGLLPWIESLASTTKTIADGNVPQADASQQFLAGLLEPMLQDIVLKKGISQDHQVQSLDLLRRMQDLYPNAFQSAMGMMRVLCPADVMDEITTSIQTGVMRPELQQTSFLSLD